MSSDLKPAQSPASISDGVKPTVFLSYAHGDAQFARALRSAMEPCGIIVKQDVDLVPGPEYERQLKEYLQTSHALVFVISPSSADSEPCAKELSWAALQSKRVLPVVCRNVDSYASLPSIVRTPQWIIPGEPADFGIIAGKLHSSLLTDFDLLRVHTDLQNLSQLWNDKGRPASSLLRRGDLAAAEEWMVNTSADPQKLPKPTNLEIEFILASRAYRDTWMRVVLGIAASILIMLGILLVWGIRSAARVERAAQDKQNALDGERKAVADRQAALTREEEQRLRREKAEVEARIKAAEATQQARESKANRTVLAGERLIDSDPAKAIAFAVESHTFASTVGAQMLIRRAALELPEYQRFQVETRAPLPAVIPHSFLRFRNLLLMGEGSTLVAHHESGLLSAWNVTSGRPVQTPSDRRQNKKPSNGLLDNRKYVRVGGLHSYPQSIAALTDDGSIELHRLRAGGSTSLILRRDGPFTGMYVSEYGRTVLGWTTAGILESIGGIRLVTPTAVPEGRVVGCGAARSGQMLACIADTGHIRVQQIDSQKVTDVAPLVGSTAQIDRTNEQISVFIIESLNALIVTRVPHDEATSASAEVIDIASGQRVFQHSKAYSLIAIDDFQGKFAFVDNGHIEQYVVQRTGSELSVSAAEKWPIEDVERDVGEPQAAEYGPYGRYLLTANAPIMTLVSAVPSTVRLWYANAFPDKRFGDVHRGKTISSREQPVLNICFDNEGRRIAAITADGSAHVWDVFPEEAISFGQKADDFFSKFYHAPLTTRVLSQDTVGPSRGGIEYAADLFRVRLTPNELSELRGSLSSAQGKDALLRSEIVRTPSTIALQDFGTRDTEQPVLMITAPSKGLASYDPLNMSDVLKEVLDSIIDGEINDTTVICQWYLRAVEKDLFLLTGLQIPRLVKHLSDDTQEGKMESYVLLALSGDLAALEPLRRSAESERDKTCRRVAEWAIRFLAATGRDLRPSGRVALRPEVQHGQFPFSAPDPMLSLAQFPGFLTIPANEVQRQAIVLSLEDTQKDVSIAPLAVVNFFMGAEKGYTEKKNFAILLRDRGHYDAALAWNRLLFGLAHGDAESEYAHVLFLKRDYSSALRFAHLAIVRGRVDGAPESTAGDALAALGRPAEAIKMDQKAVLRSEAWIARIEASRGHLPSDEYEELRADAERRLPQLMNSYAWNVVTFSGATQEQLSRALQYAAEACERSQEQDPEILDTLAEVRARLGQVADAVRIEERAADLWSDQPQKKQEAIRKTLKWKGAGRREAH